MTNKRKATMLTPYDSVKKFGYQPFSLNDTEPPTLRQVIQFSYFFKNSHPYLKDYDIAKIIANDVIKIQNSVNPLLPLHDKYM